MQVPVMREKCVTSHGRREENDVHQESTRIRCREAQDTIIGSVGGKSELCHESYHPALLTHFVLKIIANLLFPVIFSHL